MEVTQQKRPREAQLVLNGSPCTTNFWDPTVTTRALAGHYRCPQYEQCKARTLGLNSSYRCVMDLATEVARSVLKEAKTVQEEVRTEVVAGLSECGIPLHGYISSDDGGHFEFLKTGRDILDKVEAFAAQVLGVAATERHPESVGGSFGQLMHSVTKDGVVDLRQLDQMEGRFAHLPGRNRRCDVSRGPCACGAWHF